MYKAAYCTKKNFCRSEELEKELAVSGAKPNYSVQAIVENVISSSEKDKHSFLKAWWATQCTNLDVPNHLRRYPPSVVRYELVIGNLICYRITVLI